MSAVAVGTLLVVTSCNLPGDHLGRVIRPARAKGWNVQVPGEAYLARYEGWIAERKVARIGDTVCEHPYLTHFCGRAHLSVRDLEQLRASSGATA